MERIKHIFSEMKIVVDNPRRAVQQHKEKTGRGAVGCFPVYCPEEIVHAAGLLPVGLWGGQTTLSRANTFFPAFACSIMQSVMEFALKGVYNDLLAVIIPAPCDTLKSFGQDWPFAVPDVKSIPIVYPQLGYLPEGMEYLKSEFENVRVQLEKIGALKISDAALNYSVDVYNEHRQVMREFTKVAPLYPTLITPVTRHLVMKSAYFMEKSQHTAMVRELITELTQQPPQDWKGKKVILSGIMAEPDSLLEVFIENGLTVVGDDLAHESRQYRTDAPAGNDPLMRLARQWAQMKGCSMVYDPQKKRGDMLIKMVRDIGADAVVLCMMKFCDPEEFDYPVMKVQFEEAGIPLLYLEIDQQMQSMEQARTRLQSFAEMLSGSDFMAS